MTAQIFLTAMILPLAAFAASNTAICGSGTLIDVQVDTQIIQRGWTEHSEEKVKKNGKTEYRSHSTPNTAEKTTYTVTVQLDDVLYTAQSEGMIFGLGFKPTEFVINDPVQGCVRGKTLALARPDGKEYHAGHDAPEGYASTTSV